MKIEEVLLKEYETGNIGKPGRVTKPGAAAPAAAPAAQPSQSFPVDDGGYDAMGNVTTGMPSASPTNVAAPAPGSSGQTKWPTTKAEIIAFQTANKLKPDGMIGAKTMAALQKSGATPPAGFKPVGNKAAAKPPKAGADAQGNVPIPSGGIGASTQAQVDAANAQRAPAGSNPNNDSSNYSGAPTPTAPAAPSPEPAAPDPEIARMQQLGGMKPQVANPFAPAPQADNPNPPPAAAAPAAPAAGDAAQAAPPANNGIQPQELKPVTTGTGGNLTTSDGKPVMTGSQTKLPDGTIVSTYDIKNNQKFKDKEGKEYIAQINPMNKQVTFNRNFSGVGDFVNNMFGKKAAPAAAPAAPAAAPAPGQGSQPTKGPQTPGGYGQFSEEASRLRRLAGLE